jgi:hypothetical protein
MEIEGSPVIGRLADIRILLRQLKLRKGQGIFHAARARPVERLRSGAVDACGSGSERVSLSEPAKPYCVDFQKDSSPVLIIA